MYGMGKPTDDSIAPPGKIIKEDKKESTQVSIHVYQYHKDWLDEKREEETFILSEKVRELLDHIIVQDEVDLPDETFINPEDVEEEERSGIEVFITD